MVNQVAGLPSGAVRELPPVMVLNADGRSPFVLVCDHASNRIPERYANLGLTAIQRLMHIAWDPGALAVCHALVDLLDAPLVHSTVSRLVIDCNRAEEHPGLIWTLSEDVEIAANAGINAEERTARITRYHRPFHDAIDGLLERRRLAGQQSVLVCMHSFTPVYLGEVRPWPVGVLHGRDPEFTRRVYDAILAEAPGMAVGWNQPYAALTGVTLTLERHGDGRGLPATMIEIRNDEILQPSGVAQWAERLARCLTTAFGSGGATGIAADPQRVH